MGDCRCGRDGRSGLGGRARDVSARASPDVSAQTDAAGDHTIAGRRFDVSAAHAASATAANLLCASPASQQVVYDDRAALTAWLYRRSLRPEAAISRRLFCLTLR